MEKKDNTKGKPSEACRAQGEIFLRKLGLRGSEDVAIRRARLTAQDRPNRGVSPLSKGGGSDGVSTWPIFLLLRAGSALFSGGSATGSSKKGRSSGSRNTGIVGVLITPGIRSFSSLGAVGRSLRSWASGATLGSRPVHKGCRVACRPRMKTMRQGKLLRGFHFGQPVKCLRSSCSKGESG